MSDRLDRQLTIRLNPEERALIEMAARVSGLTVSAFMRKAIAQKLAEADDAR